MSVFEYARRVELEQRAQRWYRVHLIEGAPAVRFKAATPREAAERVARIFGSVAVRVERVR